jgi:hypothetical protein
MRQRSSTIGIRPRVATGSVVARSSSLTAARLPSSQEGDRRQLVVGVGQNFQQRDRGARERADDDTGQHQHEDRLAAAHGACDQQHEPDRAEPDDEGQELDAQDREREEDAEHGAEAGTGRDAQNVGRDQRVAEQALVGGASSGERGADQHGSADPRQADE